MGITKYNANRTIEVRFFEKVDKSGDCWLWTGATVKARNGARRGSLWFGEKTQLAHRVSWIIANGAISSGLKVCHHCDTPLCVNPSHLFLGTQKDNMEDCAKKGRIVSKTQKSTHCKRGHELSGDNLKLSKDGVKRQCKSCVNERQRGRAKSKGWPIRGKALRELDGENNGKE